MSQSMKSFPPIEKENRMGGKVRLFSRVLSSIKVKEIVCPVPDSRQKFRSDENGFKREFLFRVSSLTV